MSEQEEPEEGVDGHIDEEEGTKEVLKELRGKDVVHRGATAAHELRTVPDDGDENLGKHDEDNRHEKAGGGILKEHKR